MHMEYVCATQPDRRRALRLYRLSCVCRFCSAAYHSISTDSGSTRTSSHIQLSHQRRVSRIEKKAHKDCVGESPDCDCCACLNHEKQPCSHEKGFPTYMSAMRRVIHRDAVRPWSISQWERNRKIVADRHGLVFSNQAAHIGLYLIDMSPWGVKNHRVISEERPAKKGTRKD